MLVIQCLIYGTTATHRSQYNNKENQDKIGPLILNI